MDSGIHQEGKKPSSISKNEKKLQTKKQANKKRIHVIKENELKYNKIRKCTIK